MLRVSTLAALVLIVGTGVLAPPAAADELGIVVERTTPTQKNVHVVVYEQERGPIEIHAYRIGNPGVLLEAGVDLRNGRALKPYGMGADADAARKADPAAAARFQRAGLTYVAKRKIGNRTTTRRHLEVIRFEQAGLYLLEARANGMVARATAVVSDLAVVVKRAPQQTLVWALDRRTGKPWPGVTLRTGARLGAAGTTGADGVAVIDAGPQPTLRLVAAAGDHLAFGEEAYFPTIARDRRVYAFPHQPAYRPGERAEVYGVVRAYENGRYRLDPSAPQVTVQLHDSRGGIVAETPAPVSGDLGTFRCGFDLDPKAPTGDWRIVVAIGDDTYEAPLRVAAYRKPAFEVQVKSTAPRVLAGEAATFDIAARFYDGGIVAGAKVTWQLVHNRVDRELFPTDELVKMFFGTEREAYKPETLQTGEGVLDTAGHLSVSVSAPPGDLDGYLTLRATVFGPDRIAVAGSGGLSVAASPVRVDIETDKHLYGPEDEVLVTIKVETADGKPAAERAGVFTLAHLLEGPAGSQPTETWTRPQPFQTSARGEARLRMTVPREGRFRFMAVVPRLDSEPAGGPAQAHVHAWALGDKPTLAGNPGPLEVVADKDHYAVGDTARFLVRAPGTDRSVLSALEGATLLRHEVLAGASIWTVRIEPGHAPNIFATFATVYRGELMLETRMLRVPPVRQLLTAEITPDHAELAPGRKTGATVRVTDHEGKPVADAELAVAVVDEALYGLYADPSEPIEPFFHSLRRNNVKTIALLHHDSVDLVRGGRRPEKKSGWTGADPSAPVPAPSTAPSTPPPGDAAPPAPEPEGTIDMDAGEDASDDEATPLFGAEAEERLEEDEGGGDFHPLSGRAAPIRPAKKPKGRAATPPLEARKDFRSCVHWIATLRTDAEGKARLDDIQLADSLTRWRIAVRAVDASTRVGSGTATFLAKKKLSVDAAPPRFLRAGDRVEIPVLLRNLTQQAVEAALTWWIPLRDPRLPYDQVASSPANGPSATEAVTIAAGATERRLVTFPVPGVSWATIEATAKSDIGSDKVVRIFPVLPQGIEKVVGRVIPTAEGRGAAELRVPASATPGSVTCRVSLEASSVQAIVAALPYLLDYPHGCTEQTMNRFGPLLDVQAALKALGIPARGRLEEIDEMLAAGLARLGELQHPDGGFGWWPTDTSGPVMTALVVRGLTPIPTQPAPAMLARAVGWLQRWWKANAKTLQQTDAATVASVAMAVLEAGRKLPEGALEGVLDSEHPHATSPITQAWFLRAAHAAGKTAWVATLRKRLIAAASTNDAYVWWAQAPSAGAGDPGPTRWQDDPIEGTAEALFALGKTDPRADAALLQRGANWLLAHRPGGDRWRSTRDTAAAVRFLTGHALTTGALGTGRTVEVRLGGRPIGSVTLSKEALFDGSSIVELDSHELKPGATLALEILADGPGVMGAASLTYFETGPAIRRASNGLEVTRRWFRLDPVRNGGTVVWTRTPVTETVASGTLLECELMVKSPKSRDYVMVQDPYAAGFEPEREYGLTVEGRRPAAEAHVERYDDRVVFFVTELAAGETVLRHLVRATHVGDFTALPAQAELMYFPEVCGNGDGEPLQVTDAGPTGVKEDR